MPDLPITLRSSSLKMGILLFGSAMFVAAGIGLFPNQPFIGALLLLVSAVGFVVGAIGIIPNSFYLLLNAEGFTMVSFFRKHFVPWECVESFQPAKVGLNAMVGWNYAPEYRRLASYAPANLRLAGIEAALPDNYGMTVEALSGLMNSVKAQSVHSAR
jgi:hypothetical protein